LQIRAFSKPTGSRITTKGKGFFWFLCENEVYTDSLFGKIVLKVLPDKHFTIPQAKTITQSREEPQFPTKDRYLNTSKILFIKVSYSVSYQDGV